MFEITTSVDNFIFSMAQMGGVDLGSSVYSFQTYGQGDDKREKHNKPHIHVVLYGKYKGVSG